MKKGRVLILSDDEVKSIFYALDPDVKEETDPLRRMLLLRDKTMFLAMHRFGLKTTEVAALNLGSFETDPEKPELGMYGMICVPMKRGGYESRRMVKAIWPKSAKDIARYVAEARPGLAKVGGDDRALFIGSRGKRMTPNGIRARFRIVLAEAGIQDPDVTLSALRHTFVEDACEHLAVEDICEMIGEKTFVSFRRDTDPDRRGIGDWLSESIRKARNRPDPISDGEND